ncbi:hypothetical protein ACN47E_005208 [Coniothyrium glycines]
MPTHHPGTYVAQNVVDKTDVPWALTTHLLSINHEQLIRATQHPFLARAANGNLAKPVIAQWLVNDREYVRGYIATNNKLAEILRSQNRAPTAADAEPDIETRLTAWCVAGAQNGEREIRLFNEVSEIYKLGVPAVSSESYKTQGLRLYEILFSRLAAQQPNTFIPWLEAAVLLWSTEKCYYEAWSWARRQDAQSSPRNFDNDQDGGAMRREFIPNWSNRDFLMFVEQLERIINEGVSEAVGRDDEKWKDVKKRTDSIWRAVLDAEDAFWPDVDGVKAGLLQEAKVDGVRGSTNGTALEGNGEVYDEKKLAGDIDVNNVKWNGHVPLV